MTTTSAHLRAVTTPAHEDVERAFDLDARLTSRQAYAALLVRLRGFYGPVEQALGAWAGALPGVDVTARRRAALLDDDLADLGASAHGPPVDPPGLPTAGHALGCLYVLEGSALGGRLVLRAARERLGDDLPVAFFGSVGREHLGADWRALKAALDLHGEQHGEAGRAAVVDGALATFTAMSAWMRG